MTTKIHVISNSDGLPIKLVLTGGNVHDSVPAIKLLENLIFNYFLADKAYDSIKIVDVIENQGSEAVIPSRKTNLVPRNYDKEKYKERNLIERFFSKIKHFRRIATRYEKLANNYKSMILLSFIMIWIRF